MRCRHVREIFDLYHLSLPKTAHHSRLCSKGGDQSFGDADTSTKRKCLWDISLVPSLDQNGGSHSTGAQLGNSAPEIEDSE